MEHQQEDQQNRPVPCLGGCGFYGNPLTGGLCSKCSRAQQVKKTDEQGGVTPTSPQHSNSAVGEVIHSTPGKATASSDPMVPSSASELLPPSVSPTPSTPQQAQGEDTTMSDGANPSSVNATDGTLPSPPVDETSSIASLQSVSAAASIPSTPPSSSPAVAEDSTDPTVPTRPVQTKLNRCWTCNTKVGMLGFSCRCGYTYCGAHRYADAHECDFEWKAFERKKLRDENPDATAEKIQRI